MYSMEVLTLEQLPKAVTYLSQQLNEIKALLQSQAIEPRKDSDETLTIKEASVLVKLSVPTIYGLVSESKIPVSKRGKRLYFSKQELIAWIREGRKKTVSEVIAEADEFLTSTRKRG